MSKRKYFTPYTSEQLNAIRATARKADKKGMHSVLVAGALIDLLDTIAAKDAEVVRLRKAVQRIFKGFRDYMESEDSENGLHDYLALHAMFRDVDHLLYE